MLGQYLKAWLRRVGCIVRHRDEDSLGSRRRLITVLFSNIRDFVSLCERREPEQVVEWLDAYFAEMDQGVPQYNGTIDQYVADCMRVLYNARLESRAPALGGVQTARKLRGGPGAFSRRWEARAGGAIRCGVGIHTGYAVVGTMGSEQ